MDENTQLELHAAELLHAARQIQEMEAHFEPSMMDSYLRAKETILFSVAHMLRNGAAYINDEKNSDKIYMLAGEERVGVLKDDLRRYLGAEYDAYFGVPTTEDLQQESEDAEQSASSGSEKTADASDIKSELSKDTYAEAFNTLMSLIYAPFINYMKKQDEKNASDSHEADLLKDVAELQKRVSGLMDEKKTAIESARAFKKNYEDAEAKLEQYEALLAKIQDENEEKIKALVSENSGLAENVEQLRIEREEKGKLQEEITRLQESIASNEQEIRALRETNETLMQNIAAVEDAKAKLAEEYTSRITELEGNIEQAKSAVELSMGQAKAAQDEVERLKKELENAQSKTDADATEVQKKIAELESSLQATTAKFDKEKKLYDNSQDYIKKLKEEIAELKKQAGNSEELNAAKEELAKLREELTQQKTQEQELLALAYEDRKFGCHNVNAFNRDYKTKDKDTTTLAMVSVCGLKAVNMQYGKAAGDNLLKMVSQAIRNAFAPNTDVYRSMGDQFIVIIPSANRESVIGTLTGLQNSLLEQQISIIYGIAHGNEFDSLKALLDGVEQNMNRMRMGVSNAVPEQNSTANDSSYQSGMASAQEPAVNEPVVQQSTEPVNQDIEAMIAAQFS